MDTSSCMKEISTDVLKAILKKHPRERILFGTDYPSMDPQEELEALQRRTRYSDAEIDDILANGTHLLFGQDR